MSRFIFQHPKIVVDSEVDMMYNPCLETRKIFGKLNIVLDCILNLAYNSHSKMEIPTERTEKVSVMGYELVEINNFLPKSECDYIIDFYNEYEEHAFQYRDTFPLDIALGSIGDDIERECKKYDKNIFLQTCQVVKWPPGSFMNQHRDMEGDRFAAVLYLNDDYTGGETCFEHTQIIPETGKLVIFSGHELIHSVNKVKDSARYTIAMWFIQDY